MLGPPPSLSRNLIRQVLTLSIALGTSFYFFYEHWELSTCYYYASQVLNGNMFDTPSQPDDDHTGLWFTLLLYVYGSTLMASAYGTCVQPTHPVYSHLSHLVIPIVLLFSLHLCSLFSFVFSFFCKLFSLFPVVYFFFSP